MPGTLWMRRFIGYFGYINSRNLVRIALQKLSIYDRVIIQYIVMMMSINTIYSVVSNGDTHVLIGNLVKD